ncbi:endonuclease MutS2 [Clostridium sp. KNHs216]|uniref:endonuclease MutS2 n=1 Tax=Clostridium sp. KNHs216 TaxID=1550235 RepID=UPI0011729B6B|nr:endonuclease MutS2 [Clostridium sp. KNHs216]TQI68757.1 DNA mismatch repair protein MutS2 [Clostridium sp. KNHs216]
MEDTMQRHYRALELDKIRKLLAAETACEDAAELALQLTPSVSLSEVQRLLADTDEAFTLMARFGAPSFGGLYNMTNSLRRAEAGGTLNMAELLRVAGVLRTLRGIVDWRSKSAGVKSCLDWRFDSLMPNKYLEDRIYGAILSEEEMSDNASVQLASIRRKIRSASSRVREQLDKMIRSTLYQKYLQDPIVTMRGGRFVVPVKAEFRGEIAGLVHDTSASGATVFVEPMGVVEANNEVRVLQSQEQAEIERILAELSAETGNFSSGIISGYRAAVELNLIFAKANLGYKMKASLPAVNDKGKILLKKARHPLIDKNRVVPTDIELGIHFDTLVITGPNTGGKTVSLKTVGLLTLMAMCGLMLPVAENSEISVFHQVLADIGDEQSIEQSLSTFSAHMTNIIRIIGQADGNSLILLDELGAGTDPVEGAALAMAILEALRKKGARVAATTHYAELKAYALQTDGVENACCEFDVQTLRPTYRLLIGVPGRSNAFAISLRLGMEEEIVERAKELVSSENTRFEDVVQSLETSRQKLEGERTKAEQAHLEAVRAQKEAQEIRSSIQAEADKEIEKARQQASELVSRTRGQIDALLNEMEELKKQQNKTLSAEQKARLKAGLRVLEETADPIHGRKDEGPYVLPRPLQVGDTVLLYDIDKQGTVLQLPEGNNQNVLVQAGIIQTRVPLSNLRLVQEKKGKEKRRTVTRNVTGRAQAKVTTELDLRGQTTEEAIMNVDRFIDSALLSGIEQLTVIHGKGTGALRAAVQQHLKRHPSVRSYRLGVFGEGEAGVTVVELK